MKETLKRLQDVFGTKLPTVELFDNILSEMPEKEAAEFRKKVYVLSFSHWNKMTTYHQDFFGKLFVRDRDSFIRFLVKETPLGALRYELQDPKLLIKVLHLLESPKKGKGKRLSYRHLAFSLSLAFEYHLSLSTLADYLSERNPDTKEILYLSGTVLVEDAY
jgi:hypothetical protein